MSGADMRGQGEGGEGDGEKNDDGEVGDELPNGELGRDMLLGRIAL
jgi:hypothetical protein